MTNATRGRHLRDYLAILSRRRLLVALVFTAVLALAAAVTLLTPFQYEGRSKVLLERTVPSALSGESRNLLRDPAFVETQVQIIRSRAVAERVVDKLWSDEAALALASQPAAGGFLRDLLVRFLRMVRPSGSAEAGELTAEQLRETRRQALATQISRQIRVRALQESNVLDIGYLAPSPETAALVANSVAAAYAEELLEMRMDASRRGLEWMARKAREEGGRLEEAERALHSYMKANDLLVPESRRAVAAQELSELSVALLRAEMERKELEVLVEKIRSLQKRPEELATLAVIAGNPGLQTLKAQILAAEKEIMVLTGNYGPLHPLMKKARGDLELLQQKESQETRRIIQSFLNEFELARAREAALAGQLAQARQNVLEMDRKYLQYDALRREVDTNQQLYGALLLEMKGQNITDENNPVNVWVVEAAGIPDRPARPLVGLNLLLGCVAGLLFGIGAAFGAEYFDTAISDPDEVEQTLGLPVLTVVPTNRNRKVPAEKAVLTEDLSLQAESYKVLRTAIHLSTVAPAARTLMLTSPGSGEGKSTTALNLASAMARASLRVLLIDGDLRRPSLHEMLQLGNEAGLSSWLARSGKTGGPAEGSAPPAQGLLQEGPLENLWIMTSGPIPPNPSELLINGGLDQLLAALRERFDRIIFDSPPLLSVPDALILSQHVDGTILVTRSGATTQDMAKRGLKLLKRAHGTVLGLVVNGYRTREANVYYNNYYPTHYRRPPESSRAAVRV